MTIYLLMLPWISRSSLGSGARNPNQTSLIKNKNKRKENRKKKEGSLLGHITEKSEVELAFSMAGSVGLGDVLAISHLFFPLC